MGTRITTAVIMAAGMGTRMNERGTWHPKGFIRIGAKPIIEEALELLTDVGIERVVIITGHLAEFYERLQHAHGHLIQTVFNPYYSESGSMYSLYCARELVQGDFLLLESDLIFERRALTACLEFPKDNAVLMSGHTNAGDEVYIETRESFLQRMSKSSHELDSIAGELVGICKISAPLFEVMKEEAARAFANDLRVAYETDCLVAAAQCYPVYCHLVEDLAWSEIDYEMHLEHARTRIYPQIIKRDGGRKESRLLRDSEAATR